MDIQQKQTKLIINDDDTVHISRTEKLPNVSLVSTHHQVTVLLTTSKDD